MSDAHTTVLFSLIHAADAAHAFIEARLASCGLSVPKLTALQRLVEAGDSLPMSQLADRLSCVKSNVTQLVDRLEEEGFVSREADPNDRRSRLAVITPAGRKAYAQGTRAREAAEAELFGKFSREEALQMAALLARLDTPAP